MSFGPLSAGNVNQFNSQVEQLISQIIQTESQPIRKIQEKKSSVGAKQEIFDQANSSIAGLQNKADAISGVFDQRLAETSEPTKIGVSAGASAEPGTYELTVEQLAKAHTLASHRIPAGGGNIAQFFGPGERTFAIYLRGQRHEVKFEIPETMPDTGEPPTNEDILRLVEQAIQRTSAEAGLGSEGFSADTIKDTPQTARLLLKSGLTGSENQLFFEDTE
ncbi:MAG: flagellar cap protein FliD N-terminal domain-containing protein, partial [Planctomycetota bacterium]|nr:flagellar cap protein FliD N-terminal domain-containing protein [Planctomycetota bacterium]